MRKDQRKSRRQPIQYTAWLATSPGERQVCLLSDMSETGARIDVDDPNALPERFVLLLAANGSARRACRVVWRKPHQIGVKFEPQPSAAETKSRAGARAADGHAQAAASVEAAANR